MSFFDVFLKKCAAHGHVKNIVSIHYLQCFVHIGLLKKVGKNKNEHIFRHFSGKGSRHQFFIDFGWILGPFWEDFGVQDREKAGSKKE